MKAGRLVQYCVTEGDRATRFEGHGCALYASIAAPATMAAARAQRPIASYSALGGPRLRCLRVLLPAVLTVA